MDLDDDELRATRNKFYKKEIRKKRHPRSSKKNNKKWGKGKWNTKEYIIFYAN